MISLNFFLQTSDQLFYIRKELFCRQKDAFSHLPIIHMGSLISCLKITEPGFNRFNQILFSGFSEKIFKIKLFNLRSGLKVTLECFPREFKCILKPLNHPIAL